MVWWLHHEIETNANFELITTAAHIRRCKEQGKVGAILSFEGFDALGPELRFLDLYYMLGLRVGSLTHCRRNVYADGCAFGAMKGGGLTAWASRRFVA